MVLPQIRSEFHLDDASLGLLSGPAFAITYATCGVHLALLADRVGRRPVIAGALAFFSTATLAWGLASTVGWEGTAFPGLTAQRRKSSDRGFALKLASLCLLLAMPFHAVFYLVADLRFTIWRRYRYSSSALFSLGGIERLGAVAEFG